MIDQAQLENQFLSLLALSRLPVAVSFHAEPPAGVPRLSGTMPSGCSFWRLAAEGKTFCTVPSDHFNCPIGAYTHSIDLPADRAGELPQVLDLMAGMGYVRMEDVPGLPRLPRAPGAVVYAPLEKAPAPPDVVLFAGRPGVLMLLQEAAARAGAATAPALLGRPTCMAIPAALASGTVASTGCIGNRVYTGLGEDELYVIVPGRDLAAVAAELAGIVDANERLAAYHAARREDLATG